MIEWAIAGSLALAGLLAFRHWGVSSPSESRYQTMIKTTGVEEYHSPLEIGATGDEFVKYDGLWYHVGPNGEMTGGYELVRLHKQGNHLEGMRPGGYTEIPGS